MGVDMRRPRTEVTAWFATMRSIEFTGEAAPCEAKGASETGVIQAFITQPFFSGGERGSLGEPTRGTGEGPSHRGRGHGTSSTRQLRKQKPERGSDKRDEKGSPKSRSIERVPCTAAGGTTNKNHSSVYEGKKRAAEAKTKQAAAATAADKLRQVRRTQLQK